MQPSSAPRILFVIPQMPQDPSSGAARPLTTICEMLAESGFGARALATTTESAIRVEPLVYLRSLGCELHVAPGRSGKRAGPEIEFTRRHIGHRLLDYRKPVRGEVGAHLRTRCIFRQYLVGY
jgi:hypothetical protein